MSEEHSKYTDSAGVPWQGRSFSENQFKDDNGLADPALIEVIQNFKQGAGSIEEVASVFANARLLIPLIANLGESGEGANGLQVDKSAELSIVTVKTPDGQNGLPVFSSVESMLHWNRMARPVPNHGRAVALAAASEGNTRLVLDPTSETELVFRRPAIAAIAQGLDWQSPDRNPLVRDLVHGMLSRFEIVDSFELSNGDPEARLFGQELIVTIWIEAGLGDSVFEAFETEFFSLLSNSELFVEQVDSVAVRFEAFS